MSSKRLCWAVILFLGMPNAGMAQDYLFQNFAASDALGQMHQSMRDNMMPSARERPAPQRKSKQRAVSTTYRASPAVSLRVQRQFTDFVEKTSGRQAGQQVREIFRKRNPVASWVSIVKADGFRSGDVVDAVGAYLILNWMMANGSDNNQQQASAVRQQIRQALSNNPGFSRLGNDERQTLAETSMLNFLVQHAAYIDALKRGDKVMIRRLSDAAVARFQNQMNMNLREVKITAAGFR